MNNRKYPWNLFFFGIVTNFVFHFFWMFIPGVILLLIGCFSQKCLAIGIALLVVDLFASVVEQIKIRNTRLSDNTSPAFQEFQKAFFKNEDWKKNMEEFVEENFTKTDDEK